MATISGLQSSIDHCLPLLEVYKKKKKLLHCFLEMSFPTLQPLSLETQSRKPIATSMTNVSLVLHSQTFASKNLLSTSTLLNRHNSPRIHLVRRTSHLESFDSRIVSFNNILPGGCFLNPTIS